MTNLIDKLKILILEAGKIAIQRKKQGLTVITKTDHSPVTNADKEIDDLICNSLRLLTPDIAIISEEGDTNHLSVKRFWLIDPIDGTRSYIQGDEAYTVNIGLIENNTPTIGLVYQPETKMLYYTDAHGKFKIDHDELPFKVEKKPLTTPLTCVMSPNFPTPKKQELLQHFEIKKLITCTSSLKLCYIAQGIADIFPCAYHTMEWDIAAGHALIKASGGDVIVANGLSLTYSKENLSNTKFFAFSERVLANQTPLDLINIYPDFLAE